jgi:antitoxin component YwqK of YwqJK toxin-antitoxin module
MKRLLLIVLPLLLIVGCSKPIDDDSLVERNGIHYQVNSETPYSGKSFSLHENGQKYYERTFKDGKQDGLFTRWDENGQKKDEIPFKDGEMISRKEWNRDGSVKND